MNCNTFCQALFRIPHAFKRGVYIKVELQKIAKKFKSIKTKIQQALNLSFPENSRESLTLTKIFENTYEATTMVDKAKQTNFVTKSTSENEWLCLIMNRINNKQPDRLNVKYYMAERILND